CHIGSIRWEFFNPFTDLISAISSSNSVKSLNRAAASFRTESLSVETFDGLLSLTLKFHKLGGTNEISLARHPLRLANAISKTILHYYCSYSPGIGHRRKLRHFQRRQRGIIKASAL